MWTRPKIYNVALSACLLTKVTTSDPLTDPQKEVVVLNTHWDAALRSALIDMDLDAVASQVELELIEEDPNDLWVYAYRYPSNCSFLRRIQTPSLKDNRSTQVKRRVANHNGVKVIFCNEYQAIAEYLAHDIPLSLLSPDAGLAVAYKLAMLSAPLIAGKGASALRKQIERDYVIAKSDAMEHDRLENNNFDEDDVVSEFVEARTE